MQLWIVQANFSQPVILTDRPESARWLTAEEKELAVARLRSERLAVSDVIDKIDKRKLWNGISSPVTISTSFIFLLGNVTGLGLAFFAPTIVRTIYPERTTVQQQLFTVPPYIAGAVFTVLLPGISYRMDTRQIFLAMCGPPMMAGFIMYLASTNPQVRYAASFLVATSAFATGPLANAQVSVNVVGDTARTSAIGLNGMFCLFLYLLFVEFPEPSYLNMSICSLAWKHWRPERNLVLRSMGCTSLPNRQWTQPCDL